MPQTSGPTSATRPTRTLSDAEFQLLLHAFPLPPSTWCESTDHEQDEYPHEEDDTHKEFDEPTEAKMLMSRIAGLELELDEERAARRGAEEIAENKSNLQAVIRPQAQIIREQEKSLLKEPPPPPLTNSTSIQTLSLPPPPTKSDST